MDILPGKGMAKGGTYTVTVSTFNVTACPGLNSWDALTTFIAQSWAVFCGRIDSKMMGKTRKSMMPARRMVATMIAHLGGRAGSFIFVMLTLFTFTSVVPSKNYNRLF